MDATGIRAARIVHFITLDTKWPMQVFMCFLVNSNQYVGNADTRASPLSTPNSQITLIKNLFPISSVLLSFHSFNTRSETEKFLLHHINNCHFLFNQVQSWKNFGDFIHECSCFLNSNESGNALWYQICIKTKSMIGVWKWEKKGR